MARVQAGDRDAYRALLDDIARALTTFLRRRLYATADLDDAYQDTLLALHRGLHTYDPARPFEPWLFAIARHVASDYARAGARRAARERLVDTMPDPGAGAPGALGVQLARALRALPPSQREAFTMVHVEGMTVAEAAERAGTTTGALKVRTHRASAALRSALSR